jgi:hypothetical protein
MFAEGATVRKTHLVSVPGNENEPPLSPLPGQTVLAILMLRGITCSRDCLL